MKTKIMQNFPLTKSQRIPRKNWDRAPWNRWSFQNVRQILPTTEVRRDRETVWQLPRELKDLDSLPFSNGINQVTSISEWLKSSFTDGFIVLHNGVIVYERYLNNMTEHSLHLSQSVAKSIVSTVAGVLVGRGVLRPEVEISDYVPELKNTAWSGALLQHVMDMTTGVRFVEDYDALDSDMALTDIASGWKPKRRGVRAPDCIWDQILSLNTKIREHGELFQYRSIETDVLAHCMERVTQTRLADLVSRELWSKLGCEENAYFTVDSAGYALADGGYNACLRDYARFGQMLLNKGMANGKKIVSSEWIDDITINCDSKLYGPPYTDIFPNGAYRNQFWIEDHAKRTIMARGVFGQLIYVNPDENLVIVKLSSWPEFLSLARNIDAHRAINAIAALLNKPSS